MSGYGGIADSLAHLSECPLIAKSGSSSETQTTGQLVVGGQIFVGGRQVGSGYYVESIKKYCPYTHFIEHALSKQE
jgi:hypothetical protein